jgi:hypothetical protein
MGCVNLNSPEVIPNLIKRRQITSLPVFQFRNFGMDIRRDNARTDARIILKISSAASHSLRGHMPVQKITQFLPLSFGKCR